MQIFGVCGKITEVIHSRTLKSVKRKDFAFVYFSERESVENAIRGVYAGAPTTFQCCASWKQIRRLQQFGLRHALTDACLRLWGFLGHAYTHHIMHKWHAACTNTLPLPGTSCGPPSPQTIVCVLTLCEHFAHVPPCARPCSITHL